MLISRRLQLCLPANRMFSHCCSATLEMSEKYADRPIITMSMAGTGVVSRLTGETFGSALTFGAASKASAPGQIGVNELKQVLDIIHSSL